MKKKEMLSFILTSAATGAVPGWGRSGAVAEVTQLRLRGCPSASQASAAERCQLAQLPRAALLRMRQQAALFVPTPAPYCPLSGSAADPVLLIWDE